MEVQTSLVLTDIERTCCIVVQQVTLKPVAVPGNGSDVGISGGSALCGHEHGLPGWGVVLLGAGGV